jgi:hypothetical protein
MINSYKTDISVLNRMSFLENNSSSILKIVYSFKSVNDLASYDTVLSPC